MNVWRIGSNWGGLDIYPIFLKHKIAFAGLEVGYLLQKVSAGDIVAITAGQQILAIASVNRVGLLNEVSLEYVSQYDDVICLFLHEIYRQQDCVSLDFGKYDGQGRQFHQAQGEYRQRISQLFHTVKAYFMLQEAIQLLKYKKQIILQGPPGTGKTRMAKEMARQIIAGPGNIIAQNALIDEEIIRVLKGVTSVATVAGQVEYQLLNVDPLKKQVTLKKSTETEATTSFDKIRQFYQGNHWQQPTAGNDDRRAAAIAKFIADNVKHASFLEASGQFKLIQFHPSYSYEDFVRGIVAKPNEDGDGILYEAENKVLGKMANTALQNYQFSNNGGVAAADVQQTQSDLECFVEHVQERIDENPDHKYQLTPEVYIFYTDDKRFKYKGDNWTTHSRGLNLNYSELEKLIQAKVTERKQIKHVPGINSLTRHHATYYFNVLELFRQFLADPTNEEDATTKTEPIVPRNYVLIIDEINRANLSSVLGELIYALEYRGERVDSMYEIDADNKLILPPNLYIIGTMNTADRSVGHIDYAIRRRFAFVDVPPEDLSASMGAKFASDLYSKVSELFATNLSDEFSKKDVQLGHSYFIDKSEEGAGMDIRLQYEIKPILLEYVKDGILIGEKDGLAIADYISKELKP